MSELIKNERLFTVLRAPHLSEKSVRLQEVNQYVFEVAPDAKSRVVFMTGNAFTPRAQQLFENTENVRLDKPFVPDDLTRVVNEVMRRHQGAEPASPTSPTATTTTPR